jgi:hypothetical protein
MKTLIASTLAFCLLLAGCSASGAPETRPDDFRIDYRYSTGPIASPDAYTLDIVIEQNGRGSAIMSATATDGSTQTWQETFDVAAPQLDAAYALMRGAGAVDGSWQGEEPPPGSAVTSMDITLSGKQIKVPGMVTGVKQKAANTVFGAVRALAAPAEVKLEALRQTWLAAQR